MFGRMMNNYYYGKSGKGDFRKEDLPQNRRQLFTDTLKTRLSALCRINLLYMLIFLPAMIVTMYFFTNLLSISSNLMLVEQNDYASYVEKMKESEREAGLTEEQYNELKNSDIDYGGLAEEDLSTVFFPEENFYLDENGDPVFYLQPGDVFEEVPEGMELLTFPIPLEDILDEL